MKTKLPGVINGPIIGVVMKEAVRRAMAITRAKRIVFEVSEKESYSGTEKDFFTDADLAAQECYVKVLREAFPEYGLIGEEGLSKIKSSNTPYFTIDPIDGTKAFMRRQSTGIGTMVALVYRGKVIAAYVGDIMTQEVFGFRPDSESIWRISSFEYSERLQIEPSRELKEQYLLLRRNLEDYHSLFHKAIILPPFKGVEISGGSIGVHMARLWKGEMGATLLEAGTITPWDWSPIYGISKKLGFVFLRLDSPGGFKAYNPTLRTKIYQNKHDILVIHKSRQKELSVWTENLS